MFYLAVVLEKGQIVDRGVRFNIAEQETAVTF
jgi:hypothetical protein